MSQHEVVSLRRQVRVLQTLCIGCIGVTLIAATRPADQVLRARGIIIEDESGHPRLLMGAPVPRVADRRSDVTTSIVARDVGGHDRVIFGEQPDPIINGKVMRRIGSSWGMTIYNTAGDERGGFANFDQGRSTVALDRAAGDGIAMMVDEKGDFAGVLLNYNSGKVGSYKPAVQIGTVGSRFIGNISNFDDSTAGSIKAGNDGPAIISRSEAR